MTRQMSRPPMADRIGGNSGFSLVEMAVVLLLATIVLTMGLGLLRANQDKLAWNDTKARQDKVKMALTAYLRSNGRLPCPNSVAPWDGAEDKPDSGGTTCLANNGRGIVPWQTLGLGRMDAIDGWGNFFTYRVANRTPATASNWTITSGTGAFSISELTSPLTTFTLQQRDSAGVLSAALIPNPVVMIISHGKNGYGARTVGGTILSAPTGADELANAGTASTSFVDRTPTDVAAATGGLYDDQVAYLTPADLLQPLIDDKTLKGSNSAYYRSLAIQQIALASCTPPAVAPSLTNIQPTIGNGMIAYVCPGGGYFCNSGTAVSNATTSGTQRLYQLALFGAAAQDATYADLVSAYPAIAGRCP